MTVRKHLKELVRSRMKKTGEAYATARRHVIRGAPQPSVDPALRWHFPGNVPATTALRILLAHAGVRAPHTQEPFSEAMLFGIAGGIGMGVFSFLYEKENFASFFVAGRQLWQDDKAYLTEACARFGIKPVVRESSGSKTAEKQLRDILSQHGMCIAWVDMAHLPHRAMPASYSGGGYHMVTVYRVQDEDSTATIGDLTDEPVQISLADLSQARARIKKQKNRLLAIPTAQSPQDLRALIQEGLRVCHQRLVDGKWGNIKTNFSLAAVRVWAERMYGSKDKEAWERVFTRGSRLWNGLTFMASFIEFYGTGGGLCRPVFAEFLTEAAESLGESGLRDLAERYAQLGRDWSALAHAALPENVPAFREAWEVLTRRSELIASGGPVEDLRSAWSQLGQQARQVNDNFPLSQAECDDLRRSLQIRIMALYEGEMAAHAALGAWLA